MAETKETRVGRPSKNLPTIYETLSKIQEQVVCPKTKRNEEDNFAYRNLEDMLETSINPAVHQAGCALTFSDSLTVMENQVYVMATVTLSDKEGNSISVSAYAREHTSQTGKYPAQITGMCSTYARKYALCGLFSIGSGVKDIDAEKEDVKVGTATETTGTLPKSNAPAAQKSEKEVEKANVAPICININNNNQSASGQGKTGIQQASVPGSGGASKSNAKVEKTRLTPDSAAWSMQVTRAAQSERNAVDTAKVLRQYKDISDDHLKLFLEQAGKLMDNDDFDAVLALIDESEED